MKAWEQEVNKLVLHRALLRYELDVMVSTCYSSMFLQKLQITINAIEYNIGIYRKYKPSVLREVSNLLVPLDTTLF